MIPADLARERVCPLCGRGPWRALAKHVAAAHGIRARDFKEMVGLTWSTSLDAPDLSEAKRRRAVDSDLATAMRGVPHALGAGVSRQGRVGRVHRRGGMRKIPAGAGAEIQARRDRGDLLREIAADFGCTVAAVSLHMKAWRANQP